MPSTTAYRERPALVVYGADTEANRRRVIVLSAGYTQLEFHYFLKWFTSVATVVVVQHPEMGFSYEVEATDVVAELRRLFANEVYFIGLSMGARLATAVIDEMDPAERLDVAGVLPICGVNWRKDVVSAPSAKLWAFLRGPLASQRFAHWQNVVSDRKRRGPDWEIPGEPQPHHRRAVTYGESFPPKGRRAQVRALAGLEPLKPGAYQGIPMIYLASMDDQVIDCNQASAAWASAFGRTGFNDWQPSGATRHCSLNEHPSAWARGIAAVFQGWGVPLTLEGFRYLNHLKPQPSNC